MGKNPGYRWTLNDFEKFSDSENENVIIKKCVRNRCKCTNGKIETDLDCLVHDMEICGECDDGYELWVVFRKT